MWYSATAVLFVVVVGLIVSFLTGRLKLLKATKFYAYMFRLNWQNYSYFIIPRLTSSVNVLHVSLQRLSFHAVKGIKLTGKEPDSNDVVSIPNKTCYFYKISPAGMLLINFTKWIVLKLDVKIQRQIRYHVHLYQKKNRQFIFFLVNQIFQYKQIYRHTPFILFCWTLNFASTSNFTNSCNYAIVSILHITLSSSCSWWSKVIYLINYFDWYKLLKPSLLYIWWNYNLYNNIISRFTLN